MVDNLASEKFDEEICDNIVTDSLKNPCVGDFTKEVNLLDLHLLERLIKRSFLFILN